MKNIRGTLVLNDEYSDLFKEAVEVRPNNVLGSFINRILCYYENEVLQIMINHINHLAIEIASLAFDGCLVYGNHYDNLQLIEELQIKINEKFIGMNM